MELREQVFSESLKVDREAMVIRGVKVLGSNSKNRRTYTESAMRKAIPLYEETDICVDHPDKRDAFAERKFLDGFGVLRNVHLSEGSLWGDLHYKKFHPLAELVLECAERFPKKFGLSHNASGEGDSEKGHTTIREITDVRSVDIVPKPASTEGLFESENPKMKVTLKEAAKHDNPFGKLLGALLEMEEGPADPAMSVEMPDEETSGEDQSTEAFRQMIHKMIDDAIDDKNLDIQGTVSKIAKALKKIL